MTTVRNLILVLGDQLTPTVPSLAAGDSARDLMLMAELTFIGRNRQKLSANPRMAQMVRTYDGFSDAERQRIAQSGAAFLARLSP